MTSDSTITSDGHLRFSREILVASGATPSDAEVVAEAMHWADLRGRHEGGVNRLPVLARRLSRGLIRSPAAMRWTEVGPAVRRLDAGHGFGHVAGTMAMESAVTIAQQQGIGLVAVAHSNHYGVAAYYCAEATAAGCLGLTCTNATPKVAPHGGRAPVLGTNPLAFGSPTSSGAPILVDLATSSASGGAVRRARNLDQKLEPGSALDEHGRPTDDPTAVSSLLPAGGPKGFGLGLMVEILSGVLTGAAMSHEVGSLYDTWDRPTGVGHVFIAIDIERFVPADRFLERIDSLLAWVAESPPLEADRPVRYPGQLRGEIAELHAREGIPIDDPTRRALEVLAAEVDVPTPW